METSLYESTRVAVVVPTIRQESILAFLEAWKGTFADHTVFVVEDNPERTFPLSGANLVHLAWGDIEATLGNDAWIIPRRSDCIRSFGCLKAYQAGARMIVTLDDDCLPHGTPLLAQHHRQLFTPVEQPAWVATGSGLRTRGTPYGRLTRTRECVINHGLWTTVPDLDAVTQLSNQRDPGPFEPIQQVVPQGAYFPMCGMNVAFKPVVAPAMYFLLMGCDWPFDRFGDIWCGLFVKRILDHLGLAVRSGEPLVQHCRASNVWTNLRKELPGYEMNETVWQDVDAVTLTGTTVRECYRELAAGLPLSGEYWDRLKKAMAIWAGLFPDR
ncbi:MAG: hypothetical protein HY815_24575 [Candidatus Riflebacteria bacterium]|nr:hypothetical protein [Candidatus Riflebacteria bacterium]